jgi:hypothetical protein
MANENDISLAPRANPEWTPDWAPWAVLGTLVSVGILGGLGILPLGFLRPHVSSTPPAVADAEATGPLRTTVAALAAPSSSAKSDELKITAAHLVVSHRDSRLGIHQKITRTREEAKKRAYEALARARKGEPFEKLVEEYSDEPDAAKRKGVIGTFQRRHAIPGFGEAAFKLAPGEISGVVETGFGFHVILRTK